MKPFFGGLVLASFLASVAASAQGQEGVIVERVVAIVDKDVVLMSEVERVVDDYMRAEPPRPGQNRDEVRKARRREILETLIADKLLEAEVKKLRIEVTKAEIDRIVEDTKKRAGLDDMKFQQALAQQGLTLQAYREGMKKQVTKAKIVELKVKKRVQITDQDVASTLAKRRALSKDDYKVKAAHILFLVKTGADTEPQRLRAMEAMARVNAGEAFEAVAREVSEGPSAPKGGDLGVFGRGEMVPEFEQAAFTADPGSVVGPVKTQFGWHVIKVLDRVKAEVQTAQLEAQVRQQLYIQSVEQEFARYVAELREKAYVEIRD